MANKIPINSIICGDCLDRMGHIPDEVVDLIYLDPPFFSGKSYDLIWGDSKATIKSFEDAAFYKKVCGRCGKDWGKKDNGDDYEQCKDPLCKAPLNEAKDVRMNDVAVYTAWLKDRLWECKRVLKPTGSIYVHLDWHAVHYVKVAMDDIFGYDNFRNDITWCYSRPSAPNQKQLSRCHDTILWYSKGDKWVFNGDDIRIPYAKSSIDRAGYGAKASKMAGGVGKEAVVELKAGGKLPEDWWNIPMLKGNSKERIGYPTQKPEALLERIILASSNKGDLILDPFCGCGTTITVAQRLDRKWVGIDIEPLSCTIQQIRMERTFGLEIPIIDLGKTLSEEDVDERVIAARKMNPYEFQDWVVAVLEGKSNDRKSGDGGIDGWIGKPFSDLKKGDPIQVKRSDKIGTQPIRLFAHDTQAIGRDHGLIVAFGFASTAEKEANIIRARDGITIELLTVKNMLMKTGKNIKSAGKQDTSRQGELQ